MPHYPWSELGLSGPADEAGVRRAYASRLKVVRPDQDAERFQALVAARDAAIRLARAAREAAFEEQDQGDDEEHRDDETGIERVISVEAAEVAPVVDLAPHGPPSAPMLAAGADEVPRLVDPSPRPLTSRSPEPEPPAPLLPRTPRPSLDDMLEQLRALMSDWPRPSAEPTPQAAEVVLAQIADMSREARNLIEPAVLEAVAPALAGISQALSASPRLWDRWQSRNMHQTTARKRALIRSDLVLGLDESFGWTTSDRHLHAILGPQQAASASSYLQAILRGRQSGDVASRSRRRANGMPLLDVQDMQSFFGDETAFYAGLYRQSATAGRWLPHWNTRWFLLAPLWMLGHWHLLPFAAWIAALWAAFAINAALTSASLASPPPWWLDWAMQMPIEARQVLFILISVLPLIGVHAGIGAYGHVLRFRRLLRRVRSADGKGIFHPSHRHSIMRRGAMAVIASAKPVVQQRTAKSGGGIQWWHIALALAVVRLIAMLLGLR